MSPVALLPSYLGPPAPGGYAIVLIAPLFAGVIVYRLLLVYYRRAVKMKDFRSLIVAYLGYRHRGRILFSMLLTLPIGSLVAAQLIVPDSVGKPWFVHKYSTLLQTIAGAIIALLLVLAVQARVGPRQTQFAVREAVVVGVLWTGIGEVATLAALSPGLPAGLQYTAFSLMVGGAVSGLLALVLVAVGSDGDLSSKVLRS
jgi:hypothetical protein